MPKFYLRLVWTTYFRPRWNFRRNFEIEEPVKIKNRKHQKTKNTSIIDEIRLEFSKKDINFFDI